MGAAAVVVVPIVFVVSKVVVFVFAVSNIGFVVFNIVAVVLLLFVAVFVVLTNVLIHFTAPLKFHLGILFAPRWKELKATIT